MYWLYSPFEKIFKVDHHLVFFLILIILFYININDGEKIYNEKLVFFAWSQIQKGKKKQIGKW